MPWLHVDSQHHWTLWQYLSKAIFSTASNHKNCYLSELSYLATAYRLQFIYASCQNSIVLYVMHVLMSKFAFNFSTSIQIYCRSCPKLSQLAIVLVSLQFIPDSCQTLSTPCKSNLIDVWFIFSSVITISAPNAYVSCGYPGCPEHAKCGVECNQCSTWLHE